jgi:uncharacterized protein
MIEESMMKKLAELLEPYEDAFILDELHGFLYGISITPAMIPPSEWLPVVFGGEFPVFEPKSDANIIMGMLIEAYNQFVGGFHDGLLEFPFDYNEIKEDDSLRIEDWCRGLSQGMRIRGHLWVPNEEPEEMDEMQDEIMSCIAIIEACSDPEDADKFFNHKHSTDPKVKEAGIDEDELIMMLFGNLPMAVNSLTECGAKMAAENQNIATPEQPIRLIKIGRNEPCPCGSGKKFKKCCIGTDYEGGPTIH